VSKKKETEYHTMFRNKKATHNFQLLQDFTAGIVLQGTEIKSIRLGKVSFMDCYAKIENNEVWLQGLHISPYEYGSYSNHEATRSRKLLLNKIEIKKIKTKLDEKGMTLVPKNLFINDKGLCKVTISLAIGKKLYDKREDIKERDEKRDDQRRIKNIRTAD